MWTFQCLNHLTPPYLDDVFVSTFKLHHYLTRQRNGIHLPNHAMKRSFGYMGATVWNSLPKHTFNFILISVDTLSVGVINVWLLYG